MAEHRMTIVIADDPDTEEVGIRALGDHFLPAPIVGPRRDFDQLWAQFGERMKAFMNRDHSDRGPFG
jgi:hypothetical protein